MPIDVQFLWNLYPQLIKFATLFSALAKFKEETKNEFPIYAIDNDRFGRQIAAETNYWTPQEGVPFFGMFKGGKKLFEIDPRSEKEFLKFFKNPTAPFRPPAGKVHNFLKTQLAQI